MNQQWGFPAEQEIRGALFGCGQVSVYHLRAWQAVKNIRIVALANRTIEKAHILADQFGISREHVYSSHLDLLKNEDVDFVDIATAPDVHFLQVMDAAQYGRHILCQKPFAPTLAEANKMIRAADDAEVLFSINENWRWRSWYREIKSLLQSGSIDKPNYLYIRRHQNVTLPTNQGEDPALLAKQPYTRNLSRLILFEWGIHIVDVTRFLFEDALSLYASQKKVSQLFKGEDRIILHLNYPDLDALLDLSWGTITENDVSSPLEQVVIEGDDGSIQILPGNGGIIRLVKRDGISEQPAVRVSAEHAYQESYTRSHAHFIECLRSGSQPETNAHDNIKTLATVFAAYDSARTNQVIDLEKYFIEAGIHA
jgi:predicted dehydrogenase